MRELDLLQFGSPIMRVFYFIVALVISGLIVQFSWVAIEKRLEPITRRRRHNKEAEKKRVFALARSQKMDDGIIYLSLRNRLIKPNIEVSQIEIGDRDKVFSRRSESFLLSMGESQEIPFIKVSKTYKYFSVVDYIREDDFIQFPPGKYKFDISIKYGNGSAQWIPITMSYMEPDQITLEIGDD